MTELSVHEKNMALCYRLLENIKFDVPKHIEFLEFKVNELLEKIDVLIVKPMTPSELANLTYVLEEKYNGTFFKLPTPGFSIPPQMPPTSLPVTKTAETKQSIPSTVGDATKPEPPSSNVDLPIPAVKADEKLLNSPIYLFQVDYCSRCREACSIDTVQGFNRMKLCLSVMNFNNNRKILEIMLKNQRSSESSALPKTPQTPGPSKFGNANNSDGAEISCVEDIQPLLPDSLRDQLDIQLKEGSIVIKPKQFLGSKNFAELSSTVRRIGGEYISAGRNSHFTVPTSTSTSTHPLSQGSVSIVSNRTPVPEGNVKRADPKCGGLNDSIEIGAVYLVDGLPAVGARGNESKYYRIQKNSISTEEQQQDYALLFDAVSSGDKKAIFGGRMFRWILSDGSGDIGVKHQKT